MTNPLLNSSGLPRFTAIKPEHIEPALDVTLAYNRAAIDDLLKANPTPTWDNVLRPLEDLHDGLQRMWSPARHLHAVADDDALRAAYSACLPKLSDYATELGQHEGLYQAYRRVADGPEYETLGVAERKIIDNALRDFRLSGIEASAADKQRIKEIKQRLSQLQTRFEEHVLDATHAWKKHITDAALLAGLPESAMALARQTAEREGLSGWLFTLDAPSYIPVVTYADNRDLRREFYEAYVTRASDQGPNAGRWDNGPLMVEILALRRELAKRLGYDSYAGLSLATKMAKDPQQVLGFLTDLARRSKPVAEREFQEIQASASGEFGAPVLQAWDIAYYSEKLRQSRYAVSQEQLRAYFPVPRVLDGLFSVVSRLYGLDIKARTGIQVWDPEARFFEIYDQGGRLRGMFYLDLFARPHKRGGAWMDECIVRKRLVDGVQTPVAYLTCNFTPPIDGRPALLRHEEVITLFHEFGHGLHHLLTLVDYPSVAGINGVAWDAVELPSQFMENWCWERDAVALISGHHETGKPIDDALFERMRVAKNFQAGMQMARQLEFALFDFRLHAAAAPLDLGAIQGVLDAVRAEIAVVHPPEFNRFQHGFSHIFAGGYAAGYYSYKWAEVLAADAFSLFESNGIFDTATGGLFLHTVLEQGGARDPMDLFVEFRGREPSVDALLRRTGITA
jgi:oligopeptidase A